MAPFGQVTEAFSSLLAQRHLRKYDPAASLKLAESWLRKNYQPIKRQPASGARMPKLRGERHIVGTGEPLEPGYSLHDPSRAWDELVYTLALTAEGWEGRRRDVFEAALHECAGREGRGIVERRPDPESPVKPTSAIETPQTDKRKRGSLTERITSRFSKTERQAIEQAAERAGITPSEYLRTLADEDRALHRATSGEPASLVGQDE